MTETTPNLNLPYILPSQAMKHITHNEALQLIDAATHAAVAATLATPPVTPSEGSLYMVDAAASGPWTGKSGKLAFFIDGAWIYLAPRAGWRAWFATDGRTRIFDGTNWIDPLANPVVDELGISTTPDATNRLAVSSEASLFNHAGTSHRMKLNKQSAGDTASLLFQSNWSGRAEIGLLGSDTLQFKTSPDGGSWAVGLEIGSNGVVHMPGRPMASATLAAGTLSLTAGALVGFDTLTLSQGGFALGSALSSGHGNTLIVPTDGIYAVSVRAVLQASGTGALALAVNGAAAALSWKTSAATAALATQAFSGLVALAAGDALAFVSAGSLSLQTGGEAYELALQRL